MGPSSWLAIAAVCLSGAMSPGPSLAVVVKNTVAGGRSQGMAAAVGHGLGVGIYALGAVVGFSTLLTAFPMVAQVMTAVGGVYLLWMAYGALMPGVSEEHAPTSSSANGAREGFLMAFLNPKIALFFLALLGSFVPVDSSWLDRVGVAALAMSIDTGWYLLTAAVLAGTGAAAWLARQGRRLEQVTGVLLLGLGGAVLWSLI